MLSGSLVVPGGLGWNRFAGAELRIVLVEGRAIGTDRLGCGPHVDEDMRVIERRKRADAHEFLRAHANLGEARLVVKMRRYVIGHENMSILRCVQFQRTIVKQTALG